MVTKTQNKKNNMVWSKGIEWVFVNLPYVFFVGILALLYIANAHAAEHNLRRIDTLKKEVKEAEWKYMSIQKEIMSGSIQSQVENDVAANNLKVGKKLPKVIRAEKP